MIKKLLQSVREYKTPAIVTLFMMVIETVIETAIPFITGTYLINTIQDKGENLDISYIIKVGLILVGLAVVSLLSGGIGGFTSAKASSGFSKNLRHDMFSKIQTYSFHNIDKFSSSSLVTRLMTDVLNVQMSFMMSIRLAVRCPLMLILSVVMSAVMGGWLSLLFVVVIPVLGIGLFLVTRKATPAFRRVFKKYDSLNESIEENVRGMRVVKGFSKEEFEKKKFGKEADSICNDFTKAERIVAINTPLMNFCMYFNMIFILLLGSFLAIAHPSLGVKIGQISVLLTYGVQVLMSLMMLQMVYVIISISLESMRRVHEVLSEESTLVNPENPVYEIKDGSIDFENVSFKYNEDAEKNSLSNVNIHIPTGSTV
ncbi:MAG: ABC transporter ATP-binding protein, partial [Clostridia bacterium]|nr:ABC transporter ATP-binding protein [Clostridia bacterium]